MKISAKWASDTPALEDLLCARPSNAGHVVKNPNVLQSPTISLSHRAAGFLKDSGVPVYTPCQVYVSDTWKFIFMRNPKASSTALLAAIKNQLCGGVCSDKQFRRVRNVRQLEAKWKPYFVFTIVRNPWLRSLSAYTMFTGNFLRRLPGNPNSEPRQKCGLPFEEYAADAYRMRAICEAEACCAHVPSRGFMPALVDSHIADQAHCVLLPDGAPLVDYIGAAEALDAAWVDIVVAINAHAGTAFDAAPVKNPNGRGPQEDGGVRHTCDGDNVRGTMTAAAARGIAEQYAFDVVWLGYLEVA